MNSFANIIINILMTQVVPKISSELIHAIVDFSIDFQARAAKTSNPFDDIGAAFLKAVVDNVINVRSVGK